MSPRSFVCDTSIVAGIVSSFVNVPQDSIWYTRIDPYHERLFNQEISLSDLSLGCRLDTSCVQSAKFLNV